MIHAASEFSRKSGWSQKTQVAYGNPNDLLRAYMVISCKNSEIVISCFHVFVGFVRTRYFWEFQNSFRATHSRKTRKRPFWACRKTVKWPKIGPKTAQKWPEIISFDQNCQNGDYYDNHGDDDYVRNRELHFATSEFTVLSSEAPRPYRVKYMPITRQSGSVPDQYCQFWTECSRT